MKLFDINNPRHIEILREELAKIPQLLREYNEDSIWASMSEDDRWDAIASVSDDDGPDLADKYVGRVWDNIPDDITDRIDLSDYKLASSDLGGRTNLRVIESFKRKDPAAQRVIDAFLKRVGRSDFNKITVKQSYQLLSAIHKSSESGAPTNTFNVPGINPYDQPGGKPSSGKMGGKWTGD